MKTQRNIVASLIISLCFTACKKDEISQPHFYDTAQVQRKSSVKTCPQFRPVSVVNRQQGESKIFGNDDSGKLISISERNGKVTTIVYDDQERVQQVRTNDLVNIADGEKVLLFKYEGVAAKPLHILEFRSDKNRISVLNKTIDIKYDSHWNKLSETEHAEMSDDIVVRKFGYDINGNCISMSEFKNKMLLKSLKYEAFDSHPTLSINIPAFNLLPGAVVHKNNPTLITEYSNEEQLIMHHIAIRYNDFGFPVELTEDSTSGSTLIDYVY